MPDVCRNNEIVTIEDDSKFKKPRKKKNRMSMSLINTPIYDEAMLNYIFEGIVQNIKLELDKQNLSATALSDLSGVDPSHLNRILKGKTKIGLSVLIKVAYTLHVTPGDLFPFDILARKTNGQRFDEITKGLELSTCNFLLGMCADYVKECKRIKNTK